MSLRDIERGSIRAFLEAQSPRFDGAQVLDYGSGAQPYRNLIEEAGGIYHGFDMDDHPGRVAGESDFSSWPDLWHKAGKVGSEGGFDVIVCTQVIQFVDPPLDLFTNLRQIIAPTGALLMTGPTNWPIVEMDDLWRFTVQGILRLLARAEWSERFVERRGDVQFEGESWPLGWQCVARP